MPGVPLQLTSETSVRRAVGVFRASRSEIATAVGSCHHASDRAYPVGHRARRPQRLSISEGRRQRPSSCPDLRDPSPDVRITPGSLFVRSGTAILGTPVPTAGPTRRVETGERSSATSPTPALSAAEPEIGRTAGRPGSARENRLALREDRPFVAALGEVGARAVTDADLLGDDARAVSFAVRGGCLELFAGTSRDLDRYAHDHVVPRSRVLGECLRPGLPRALLHHVAEELLPDLVDPLALVLESVLSLPRLTACAAASSAIPRLQSRGSRRGSLSDHQSSLLLATPRPAPFARAAAPLRSPRGGLHPWLGAAVIAVCAGAALMGGLLYWRRRGAGGSPPTCSRWRRRCSSPRSRSAAAARRRPPRRRRAHYAYGAMALGAARSLVLRSRVGASPSALVLWHDRRRGRARDPRLHDRTS